MGRKAQVVALIDPDLKDRIEILRVAVEASRARVIEEALADALPAMELRHVDEITTVRALAERAGMTTGEYARAYAVVYAGLSVTVPTLAELEADDRAVTGQKKRPAPLDSSAA